MVHTNDSDSNMQDAEIKALEDRLADLKMKREARSAQAMETDP